MVKSPSAAKRVLIIEDEWIVACDLGSLLVRLGHIPVGLAATASDGIRLAFEKKPDLILMDLQLDGPINGIRAATEIARRHKTPIIYITANSHLFLAGDSEMVYPYMCIAKPFSDQCVQAAIDSVGL
jgi:CheY-like chemotaxis protein